MGITIQKTLILLIGATTLMASFTAAATNVKKCSTAPLIVTKKNVGTVSYYAVNCEKPWETQTIRLDFKYSHDIPEWAFKQAATYFLKKNVAGFNDNSELNQITELYRPVKVGDYYSLIYQHENQKLELMLNQKTLGGIRNPDANQYFKIWFGAAPFNAKLKQQLLN
ncbi:chalcone isomerase family protein [Acinetobacter zhairhuonensis]|uniref:chalcone isomerase family protein n=1 Tax=Acinetobacter sp. A7.4 TaxID=2919921 RepID=UPI001F4F4B43|nr:chalcone isomerase family protein [Acinetobacter sp. A7.4]MCJ8162451.1 chalcone isomerase family protein [Acinetobacter sp. A7.4]